MKTLFIGGAVVVALAATSIGGARLATVDRALAQGEARVAVRVDGMHCATCPITVRITVERLTGVRAVSVSLDSARALVGYDPARVTPAQIVSAIERAGYQARLETP